MKTYRAEANAELEFSFPDDLPWHELDQQGIRLPQQMKFVDLVIERDQDVLLVEIKDPSISRCPDDERQRYFKRLADNTVLKEELTPKARDSYTFLHLMERDGKPIKFVVLIGLDAFDHEKQKALLAGFKDRLFADIKCETDTPWRRQHIADCVVLSVDIWNKTFADWPVKRIPTTATSAQAAA
ncbi:hypothetical protein NKH92_24550 [Mesorhizobium sp. M0871]|uniref:hypothetical protein n=1 Tax=unclassified Mesorhizobium TaxID=325217 RepID=UPI0003CE0001|nr:hypothetical protein [Mesorhizobium sp. LSHC412B00]ESX84907.1 hypothetical protein X756_23885 [Mesorhizobium sp. LSHC412B00]